MGIAFRFDNHPRVTKQGIMSATNLARLAPVEPMQPIHAMEALAQTFRHKRDYPAVDFGNAESATSTIAAIRKTAAARLIAFEFTTRRMKFRIAALYGSAFFNN